MPSFGINCKLVTCDAAAWLAMFPDCDAAARENAIRTSTVYRFLS